MKVSQPTSPVERTPFAQWQLLSTYLLAYALLIELKGAPESKLVLVGTLLLLANITTLFVALYLQVREGDRQVELSLTLAESEMREAELVHEQEQMRADIEWLLKRTGLKLETSTSSIESDGPLGKAAKMQEECVHHLHFPKRWMCIVIRNMSLCASQAVYAGCE